MDFFWQSRVLAAVPGVVHGVSTRRGGVSRPPYTSLNMGFHTGDRPEDVVENRRRWLEVLGLRLDEAVFAEQVHGAEVALVAAGDRGKGALRLEDAVPGTDALVTAEAGIPLAVLVADCVPILFAAADGSAVGVAHAGWRGTLAAVAARTVRRFAELGIPPRQLRVALGPCIRPCCYEVSEDLYQRFREKLGPEAVGHTRAGRPALDLAAANRSLLLSLGVPQGAVDVAPDCTACRTDLYFSHRAEKGKTGRMAAVIARRSAAGSLP